MFLPDAKSSFPSVKQGPEAIAASWLPFFIDPGTTMILTPSGTVTASSDEISQTTGTFAIKGRTRVESRRFLSGRIPLPGN